MTTAVIMIIMIFMFAGFKKLLMMVLAKVVAMVLAKVKSDLFQMSVAAPVGMRIFQQLFVDLYRSVVDPAVAVIIGPEEFIICSGVSVIVGVRPH